MTIYSGFSHWKWWFSIVMLVYQRVWGSTPPTQKTPNQPNPCDISMSSQVRRPTSCTCHGHRYGTALLPTKWILPAGCVLTDSLGWVDDKEVWPKLVFVGPPSGTQTWLAGKSTIDAWFYHWKSLEISMYNGCFRPAMFDHQRVINISCLAGA